MPPPRTTPDRVASLCDSLQLRVPILLAPMAGACPPALSIAVARAGGMGGCGAAQMSPEDIRAWASDFRAGARLSGGGPFQINLWIPDAAPARDAAHEEALRAFLKGWGPEVLRNDAEQRPPDFGAQCEAVLAAEPTAASSIMGLFPSDFAGQLRERGVKWLATATTLSEAKQAEAAGADAIIAQGIEAGGHRGAFDPTKAADEAVGLLALVPAIADAVAIPVIAAGGIADSRGVAAALTLGASAVLIGTGFLRSPEAALPSSWAEGIGSSHPETTLLTRAFSGRPGRSLPTGYVSAASTSDAPTPAPYPVQRGLTQGMRKLGTSSNDLSRIQAWAGQAGGLAPAKPAAEIVTSLWAGACELLPDLRR